YHTNIISAEHNDRSRNSRWRQKHYISFFTSISNQKIKIQAKDDRKTSLCFFFFFFFSFAFLRDRT
ncbi:hypothetical protein ACJX0J_006738, partial [Zea mays]